MIERGSIPVTADANAGQRVGLRRTLGLWNLVFIGMVIVQPTAPMGIYGVISNTAHGHVVSAVLLAMIAMMFTAVSYGTMARIYPSAGSAYTYVGQALSPALGYIVGWGMVMDYLLNPLICTAFCAKAAMSILPGTSFYAWIILFAAFFTFLNLRGIETSARVNSVLCIAMTAVVVLFLTMTVATISRSPHNLSFYTHPFYDPTSFRASSLFSGTSVAVLTFIGFDAVSTFSEEVRNPRRNIMVGVVLVCFLTGLLSCAEVYGAQLLWGSKTFPSADVETAFATVSRHAGGVWLFQIINFTLLVANFGSGMGSQLAAGRLLYGMGRGNALPKAFFGQIDAGRSIPRNNILFVGLFAVIGAAILEFFSAQFGGGAYQIGAEALNFGAFIAFMGVNASAFAYIARQGGEKKAIKLISPLFGFMICAFIWIHLHRIALIFGAAWMLFGVLYGAWRTRGFRGNLISFDVPHDSD